MAEQKSAAQLALEAAQKSAAAAEAAKAVADGAEIEFLSKVQNLKQIAEGRTTREANRMKSRGIAVLGYDWFSKVCANSR